MTTANTLKVELLKKTKKNEPKMLPQLLMVEREAFGKSDDSNQIVRTFWQSQMNKIVVARKADTGAIVGYAAFLPTREGKGSYLMRIAVRPRC